jgi:hypothetical protein
MGGWVSSTGFCDVAADWFLALAADGAGGENENIREL